MLLFLLSSSLFVVLRASVRTGPSAPPAPKSSADPRTMTLLKTMVLQTMTLLLCARSPLLFRSLGT
jgi:hypothetical protein